MSEASESELVSPRGSCPCGQLRFEVAASAAIQVLDCNCSICRMTGYPRLLVPASRFRLLSGALLAHPDRNNTLKCTHLEARQMISAR